MENPGPGRASSRGVTDSGCGSEPVGRTGHRRPRRGHLQSQTEQYNRENARKSQHSVTQQEAKRFSSKRNYNRCGSVGRRWLITLIRLKPSLAFALGYRHKPWFPCSNKPETKRGESPRTFSAKGFSLSNVSKSKE